VLLFSACLQGVRESSVRTGAGFDTEGTTGSLNPDGSGSSTGSGKVTGGTGAYKGSKGTFTFTGSAPANGPATLQVKGKIKY
jgi:hypothetical protein